MILWPGCLHFLQVFERWNGHMIVMCPFWLQLVQYSCSLTGDGESVMSTAGGGGGGGMKNLSSSSSLLHWGGDLLLSLASSVLVGTSVLLWAGVAPMTLSMSSTDMLLLLVDSHSSNSSSCSVSSSNSARGGIGVGGLFCNRLLSITIQWSLCILGITNCRVVTALACALVVVAVVGAACERAMRASTTSPLRVLAASCCSRLYILLWNSVHLLYLSPCRIWLTYSVVIVLGDLLAAAASDLSCWVGRQTLLLSSDSVLIFSS